SLKEIHLPDGIITIGSSAFNGCTSLTAIDIPASVEKIENWAFAGSGLVSVELPDSLTKLGDYAFADCYDLTELILPEAMREIDYSVIMNVPADTLKLPEGLEIIIDKWAYKKAEEDAPDISVPELATTMYFNSYTGYASLDIGKDIRNFIVPELDEYPYFDEKLKEINISEDNPYFCSEDGVVYNKEKTKIIYVVPGYEFEDGILTIPSTVKELPCAMTNHNIQAFAVEEGNTEFAAVDGVLYDAEKKKLIAYPLGNNNACYLIPSGTETISKGAFYYADARLDLVCIPESVKTVESGAFWYSQTECIIFKHSSTDEIDIAADFEGYYRSSGAFSDTATPYYANEGSVIQSQFSSHYKELNNTGAGSCGEDLEWEIIGPDLIISGTGEMTEYAKNEYPWSSLFFINVKFEGNGIVIPENAFFDKRYIYNLDLSGVTEIKGSAFLDCRKLNNITGHDAVTMVGDDAFLNTLWVSSFNDKVHERILGSVLVKHAGNSESAEIPENITYVASNVFSGDKCKTLYVPENGVFYNGHAFSGTAIEHVRFKGTDSDIPLSDFREAASFCTEKTFTDANGNDVIGLAIDSSNSLMTLANALSTSPYMTNMYEGYCYEITESCTDTMTDQQLINVLRDHMNEAV
ncbi:MAG: leucine-rich repeat protein, partial [Oscillospiraceae bacterium]|nr:leucine-rich repeat protein [Oscillospiraceae bacterium]